MQHPAPATVSTSLPGRMRAWLLGAWLIAAGLVGFVVLAVVFEVVVGVGGRGYGSAGRYGLAVLLIGVGLVLLARRLLATRRTS